MNIIGILLVYFYIVDITEIGHYRIKNLVLEYESHTISLKKNAVSTDMFTTTFFAYFLRFLASKYALRITIAKLRTERYLDFLSIFIHFGSFQNVFSLCLREGISSLIHDCVCQLVNYREQTSQLVMLCEHVSANQPQNW